MSDIDNKVRQSLKLLRQLKDSYNGVVELSYSGGKDSDIILELAKYAGLNFRIIHKITTIDPPGTIKHAIKNGAELIRPNFTFFELVRQHGFPTRRAQFCCKHLKEYKILDKQIQGIRKSESKKRDKMYKEPVFCRTYNDGKAEVFLPILFWSDDDVSAFVNCNGIKVHPMYYDERGNFDVKRRLGCLGCPLSIKNAIEDFRKYPIFLKLYLKYGAEWMKTHSDVRSNEKFGNIYNLFFHNYFCNSYEDYIYKTTGMFGNLDCQQWLSDYFSVDLTF